MPDDTADAGTIDWLPLPKSLWSSYSAAKLDPDPLASENQGQPVPWLRSLRRLNVIVGPNNSGKTRLLQALFEDSFREHAAYLPTGFQYRELVNEANLCMMSLRGSLAGVAHLRSPGGQEAKNLLDSFDDLETRMRAATVISSAPEQWEVLSTQVSRIHGNLRGHAAAQSLASAMQQVGVLRQKVTKLVPTSFVPRSLHFVMVPSRRSIVVARANVGTTDPSGAKRLSTKDSKAGNVSVTREPFDGSTLYAHLRSHLLGDLAQRESVRAFEGFLSDTFFPGKPVTLVPKENADGSPRSLAVKIGTERERLIHELGDGIQQIIILTFPIFEHADEHLVLFVDEPELSLHPGLQRVFANACLDAPVGDNGSRQVLMCTHSNHLLDLTIDRSRTTIYRVTKDVPKSEAAEVDPTFTVQAFDDDDGTLEALRDLGAHNTSMLMSNCAIWVEGVSDRNYYRRYLDLTKKEKGCEWLLEDTHYSFVEYGGGNITHWSFLDPDGPNAKRITSRMMIICDDDEGGKTERHEKLSKALGPDVVQVLPCREAENLLAPEVLVATVEVLERHEGHCKTTLPDYANRSTKMGELIDTEVLPGGKSKRKGGTKKNKPYHYADQYGVLKEKRRFSEIAVEKMLSVDDLSEQAQALAQTMLDFVLHHNGGR